MLKNFKKKVSLGVAAGSAAVLAAPVFAQSSPTGASSVDFTSLTSSIDFSTVVTGILAVAAIMIGVYVAIKGAKILMSMIKGS